MIQVFLFLLLLCSPVLAQEVLSNLDNGNTSVLNEELRQSRGDIRQNSSSITSALADIATINLKFNTSTGHDHDGTDSKTVLTTNLDTTGLQVDGYLYNDGGTISAVEMVHPVSEYAAGTYTEATAPTNRSTTSATYVKVKEFTPLRFSGNITVSYTTDPTSPGTYYSNVYKNGAVVGTERTWSNVETYSEDFAVTKGDIIQIYLKSNGSSTGTITDFFIKVSNPTVPQEATSY